MHGKVLILLLVSSLPGMAALPASFATPLPAGALPVLPLPDWRVPEAGWRVPEADWRLVTFTTFDERLAVLRKLAPFPLVFPAGLTDFIHELDQEEDPHNMFSPLQDEHDGWGLSLEKTYQDFLHDSCAMLGLTWSFDVGKKSIPLDFAWKRSDPRSSRQLLHVLETVEPWATDDVGIRQDRIYKHFEFDINGNDPWRWALDALISKPENYPRDWKLRFIDDTKSACLTPLPGLILWKGWLQGAKGREFVVIKYHGSMSMPGPLASFACYVFQPDGRFRSGAVFTDDYDHMFAPVVTVNPSGDTLNLSCQHLPYGVIRLDSGGIRLIPSDLFTRFSSLGHVLIRVPAG